MAILPPNDGLITETNQQYYEGAQAFRANSDNDANQQFTTSFNTDLYLGHWNPNEPNYALNNFKIYTSSTGIPGSYSEWVTSFTVVNNVITLAAQPGANAYIVVQLKTLSGGKYGTTDAEKAFGETVENNYGGYQYLKLSDAIDNFMVGYVGDGKIIQTAKKSDVLFFAKRSLQEFSYDILKSIKSQELTIPPSLSLALPQDYVNYVSMAWIDEFGVKRRIYPANNLTDSPYYTNIQDSSGVPTQDNFANNIEGTSITEERWKDANDKLINQSQLISMEDWAYWADYYGINGYWNWGQQYGISPQYANVNGWFNFNDREGKISFSSNLANKLIILEYISDGLAYDTDTKVPKLAEEALYASILSYIVSTRANQPEYIVQRLRREYTAFNIDCLYAGEYTPILVEGE